MTTDRAEAAFNHRFNRLSVQIRGSVGDFTFGDASFNSTPIINSDRNYTITEETVRATWKFKPTLSALHGKLAVNQRNYDKVALTDSITRSSDGERYRLWRLVRQYRQDPAGRGEPRLRHSAAGTTAGCATSTASSSMPTPHGA